MAQPWVAESRPCFQEGCTGRMEPEEDGDVRLWVCSKCGDETGYQRVAVSDTSCQLGVPEGVRRAASVVASNTEVFIGTIGRRPADG